MPRANKTNWGYFGGNKATKRKQFTKEELAAIEWPERIKKKQIEEKKNEDKRDIDQQ